MKIWMVAMTGGECVDEDVEVADAGDDVEFDDKNVDEMGLKKVGMQANSCRKTQAGDYDVGRVGRSGEIVIKTWKEFVLPC